MKKIVMVTLVMLFVSVTSSFAFNGDVSIFLSSPSFIEPKTDAKPCFINGTTDITFWSNVELLGPQNEVYADLKDYGGNIIHSYRISNGQVTQGSPYGTYNSSWTTLTLSVVARNVRVAVHVGW